MTPGGERATRIASLLQWAALRLDGDVATAAQAALERWVDYIVSEQGAWETVRPTHTELVPHIGILAQSHAVLDSLRVSCLRGCCRCRW